jgi:hypothetical protein
VAAISDTSESSTEFVAEGPMTASAQPQPDVLDPAKLICLGTRVQTMLTELTDTENDEAGLQPLTQIDHETIEELGEILSGDLHEELLEFNDCCGTDIPSESELRVARAQLVGWIQGLLSGMQATATAQAEMTQMAQQQNDGDAGSYARPCTGRIGRPPRSATAEASQLRSCCSRQRLPLSRKSRVRVCALGQN